MAKTTFSSGVIVTSAWLNGAQQIYFDGQDLDWHYSPLGLSSFILSGPNGLDSRYITLSTDQPTLSGAGAFIAGTAINGGKVVTGLWNFGYDPLIVTNPLNNIDNSPKSYTTNDKYNNANGQPDPSIAQKLNALVDADLVTKEILVDAILNALQVLVVDNGYYYVNTGTCNNYSTPGTGQSDTICTP
jgi:hypothetical protein